MRGLNIIYVDMPSGEVAEKSSSYDLFIFCSGANSPIAEIVGAASGGSSPSIGELWPDIDNLDEIQHRDTTIMHAHDISVRGRRSTTSAQKAGKCSRREGKKALLEDILGMSNIKSKSRGVSSTKREVAQILSDAPEAISPRMQRSFVDRRYSPSIGMGLSEWEVILDELIHMGYIVKDEPDSDHNE
jgi:hypothetical protein